jgi:predicted MFS family arabinose efflux permease
MMKRVLPLTIGSLALGLDAFVVAGMLPVMGGDLHLSVSVLGQLVTAFTLSYALLSPVFAAIATGRSIRAVLVLALAVFTLGNVMTALSSSLVLLLLSRVVAGLGAGLYMPMSVAAAAGLAGPERRGRALGMITGGMSAGVVVGVPVGLVLAQYAGWRSTMWLVVALTVIAFVGVVAFLPTVQTASAPSLKARVGVMADRRVVAVAVVTVISATCSIGSYTYLSVLFNHVAHVTDLTSYLWVWGLGGLLGSFAIGQVVDRWPDTRALVTVVLGVLGLALVLLPLVAGLPGVPYVVLFVWGIAGWSSLAPQQHRMLALRKEDGTVAVSLNSSATYLGNSIGAGVGGALLAGGLSPALLPVVFGAVVLVCGAANVFFTPSAVRAEPAVATIRP